VNISTVSVLFVLPSVVSVTVVRCVLLMVRGLEQWIRDLEVWVQISSALMPRRPSLSYIRHTAAGATEAQSNLNMNT
jgi:hypothetical protein